MGERSIGSKQEGHGSRIAENSDESFLEEYIFYRISPCLIRNNIFCITITLLLSENISINTIGREICLSLSQINLWSKNLIAGIFQGFLANTYREINDIL